MVFDRLNIVPTFQYHFSQVIPLWEMHCFYLTARTYFELQSLLSPLVGKNTDQALKTIGDTLQSYTDHWAIAGKEHPCINSNYCGN